MVDMLHVYGIPNCDTVKKARAWLLAHQVAFEFHDFKQRGASHELLLGWIDRLGGWDTLLNRRGTTWRGLSPEEQARVVDAESAADLLHQHTSAIKRPVVVWPHRVTVGFSADEWARELNSSLP